MPETTGLSTVVLGLLLLGGYVAYLTSVKAAIPRVTVLLLVGVVCGPSVLDIVPSAIVDWFPLVSQLALAMVGFLLGESFAGKRLKETGRVALVISVVKALLPIAVVLPAVRLVGGSWVLAILLSGVATATAPAAVLETIHETRSKGPLTNTVRQVVAIDDAWCIMLFSILLAWAQAITQSGSPMDNLYEGFWEIGMAVLLGVALGVPMAWLTGRIRSGETTLVEAAGFVFVCAGLADLIGASYLLATMTLGTVVANRSRAASRPFHAIERIEEPFLAIFFLLSGFKLELGALAPLGLVGATYVVARMGTFIFGSWAAARAMHAKPNIRNNIGWCLMPQAGVALGLALLAERKLPSLDGQLLSLVIAATILFEITGPLLLRWRLTRAGETYHTPKG